MDTKEIEVSLPWGIVCGKTWGDPNDAPVLMVHGLQDNAGSFDNLIPLLPGSGFHFICIDLPGHGKSSHFPKGFFFNNFLNYLEAVRRIMDSLKLEKCIYVGHSLGGHVGLFFASVFPEKIIKLVVIDVIFSAVFPTETIHVTCRERINNLLELEQRLSFKTAPNYSYDEAIQRMITSRPTPITEKGAKTLAIRSLIKNNHGFQYSLDQRLRLSVANFFSFEQQKRFIDSIKQPILIMEAYESVEVHKDLKKTHMALYKDLKHRVYKLVDGNHNVHIDYPERVAPLISEFLLQKRSNL